MRSYRPYVLYVVVKDLKIEEESNESLNYCNENASFDIRNNIDHRGQRQNS
jgi:hypothetical protein